MGTIYDYARVLVYLGLSWQDTIRPGQYNNCLLRLYRGSSVGATYSEELGLIHQDHPLGQLRLPIPFGEPYQNSVVEPEY
jgi:hypothetical protein